jgi:DNA-directed RNA polymerase specialized sigma24 family protein
VYLCHARTLTLSDVIERSLADPAAFAAIFDRHCDEILRYARARLGRDLAEDVVAETFLAAFSRRDRYEVARPREATSSPRRSSRPW